MSIITLLAQVTTEMFVGAGGLVKPIVDPGL